VTPTVHWAEYVFALFGNIGCRNFPSVRQLQARHEPSQNDIPRMRCSSALAILTVLGASVVALPYISQVEAGETVVLAKGST
jgi:hypothetical protein